MGKFYDSYKSLHEEAKNAITCKKSSELAGDINKIISNLNSLNLEWKDSVTSEFYGYVSSCVNYLTKILNSVESNLSNAETAYTSLKEKLDKLYDDDKKYQQLCNNKPEEEIVTGHDEAGNAIYGENPAYASWRKEKSDLEASCGQITIEIQEYIRTLKQVNTAKISEDLGDSSLGLAVPEFDISDEIFITPNVSDGSYEGNCNYLKTYLRAAGLTNAGIAGLMGNLYAESSIFSNNMENQYEGRYHDESYTEAIDSGNYSRNKFVNDGYGYGLAQWTWAPRKAALYDYCKSKGTSISDLQSQAEFLVQELKGSDYSSVWKILTTSNSVEECTKAVLYDFENPESPSSKLQGRINNARKFI